MQRPIDLYKWLTAAWLVLWGCVVSPAFAYPQATQSASWGYAPTYSAKPIHTITPATSSVSAYNSSYSSCISGRRSNSPVTARDMYPTYNFRSTSSYSSIVSNNPSFTPLADTQGNGPRNVIRRAGWDDPDDDDPIGVVPDPTPVGSPLILLALALAYLIVRLRKDFRTLCSKNQR